MDATTTLFSLGHLHRCGGSYKTSSTLGIDIYAIGDCLLDHPSNLSNNLLPVDMRQLKVSKVRYTHQFAILPGQALAAVHYNAEQRRRADQVQELLHILGFPGDKSLATDLSAGKIPSPYSNLTAHDVTVNRLLRGACPHAAVGKLHRQPTPSSMTAPATAPGQIISFDRVKLPATAPGGFTHETFAVDEHTGNLHVFGSVSQQNKDLIESIRKYLRIEYTNHGHTVHTLHGDAEKVNASLALLLADPSIGVKLQLSPPGAHAHRCERYIQIVRGKGIAKLSPLAFHLPDEYILYLHQSVTHSMRNSINSRSSPSRPAELVTGKKMAHVFFKLGFV